jgi:hypothetical protein
MRVRAAIQVASSVQASHRESVLELRPSSPLTAQEARLGQCCSYVKAGLAFSVLKTTRASWRLRQRIASRLLLPSACLRSR